MNRRVLGEEQIGPIQRQIAVDLVGGHLMIALYAVLPASVHQHLRAHDIGAQEQLRLGNGAVHMAFRSEIHHDIRLFFFKKRVDSLPIRNIPLHKTETGIFQGFSQIFQVARIGQRVQADHPILRVML